MTDERDHTDEHAAIVERLRDALRDRAETIEPSPDGLRHIEEELMSNQTDDAPASSQGPGRLRPWLIGGGAVAAAVLLVVIGLVVTNEDDEEPVVADSTTSTTEATTTTPTSTSTTTTPADAFPPDVDPYGVAYPSPLSSQRFESPDAAAQSYATQVLGFTELELGEFQQGDSRSGEIEITDRPGNAVTTIILRQMEDDTWYVLASVATDIAVSTPAAGDAVTSPFTTSGEALAFEGTVDVLVRTQDDPMPLGEGFVTGSGTPPAGPFEGTIEFDAPTEETPGILIYRTLSAEDGHVLQASSFPVRLTPG